MGTLFDGIAIFCVTKVGIASSLTKLSDGYSTPRRKRAFDAGDAFLTQVTFWLNAALRPWSSVVYL